MDLESLLFWNLWFHETDLGLLLMFSRNFLVEESSLLCYFWYDLANLGLLLIFIHMCYGLTTSLFRNFGVVKLTLDCS